MKKLALIIGLVAMVLGGCVRDAETASYNLSRDADNFKIARRIVFLNGITDQYVLEIQGRCSLTDQGHQLEVICQLDNGLHVKHFLGLSDNVTYFAEQLRGQSVSTQHYSVTFKPSVIVPQIEMR